MPPRALARVVEDDKPGLATRRLTFREIFVGQPPFLLVLIRIGAIACAVQGRLPTAPGGDELAAA